MSPHGLPPELPRPKDASMTLLREVLNSPIDPGYSVAAGRKKRLAAMGRKETTSVVSKTLILALAIVLGFTSISAVLSLRSRADLSVTTRQVLIAEITQRQDRFDLVTEAHTQASETVDGLHAEILDAEDPLLSATLARDELTNGAVTVAGPGLRITLKDGPGSDEDPERRVQDSDIRAVVNGLWASGAEAVSINSKRLTATSAIRSAGSAILVDLTGLSGPYIIEAIGDPAQMVANFANSTAASQLELLATAYSIGSQIDQVDELELSSGSARGLRLSQLVTQP